MPLARPITPNGRFVEAGKDDMSIASGGHSNRRRFHDVRHVAVTGSTNADVLEMGRQGEAEGIVVIAESQSAGRGRRGRSWVAEPGGALLLSVLLRPPASVASLVTAALALAAGDAIAELTGVAIGLKWPNDLIVEPSSTQPGLGSSPDYRKLAGILAEADWPTSANVSAGWRSPVPGDRVLVVAGIGINLVTPVDLPAELADRFIALDTLTGAEGLVLGAEQVAERLLDHLDVRYGELLADRGGLLDSWRGRCTTLGRQVRVDLGADDVEGTAVDIDDEGRLVVLTLTGERRVFSAGDVVHLRNPEELSPR